MARRTALVVAALLCGCDAFLPAVPAASRWSRSASPRKVNVPTTTTTTTTTLASGPDADEIERLQSEAAKLRDEAAAMEAEVRAQRSDEEIEAEKERAKELEATMASISDSASSAAAGDAGRKDSESGGGAADWVPDWANILGGDGGDEAGGDAPPKPRKLNDGSDEVELGDRVLASAAFLLPFSDGVSYGSYIFTRFPLVGALLLGPVAPFLAIIQGIPFGGFILFLALSFGSRQPDKLSRFVRFSFQQAILIDIALIFPSLISSITGPIFGKLDPNIVEPGSNFVFYFVLASVVYSVGSNALGKLPDGLPVISDAAKQSIGPF